MTVAELIAELQKLPQGVKVLVDQDGNDPCNLERTAVEPNPYGSKKVVMLYPAY